MTDRGFLNEFCKRVLPEKAYCALLDAVTYVFSLPARVSFGSRAISIAAPDKPKVSYAFMARSKDEVTGGGAAKLIYLKSHYPESSDKFNILYLVSSALPVNLDQWIGVCRKKGIKIVLNQDGVAYRGWYGKGWRRVNKPLRLALLNADRVLFQSVFSKTGSDLFLGSSSAPARIVYNSVDTELFSPASAPSRGCRILVAGTQSQYYKFETAIKAVAALRNKRKDVALLIAGRLQWRRDSRIALAQAQALIKKYSLGDIVRLLDGYTQRDAPSIYRQADLYLHPKYNDPCPTAVIEAMASGLPVVYSKSGGTPELVGDDAGVGIDVPLDWEKDIHPAPEQWAQAITDVLNNRDAMAKAARERAVSLFGMSGWLNAHAQVFDSVLKK